MNSLRVLFGRLYYSRFPRRANVALHEAVRNDGLEKVKLLLEVSPDLVFSKDAKHHTPLHRAAFNGHKSMVELLLANKAEVNAKTDFGETPLHLAASGGHKSVVELLLANRAEVNAKTGLGATPLHEAAHEKYEPRRRYQTQPQPSAHQEVAALLLANGADANAKDCDDETPLHRAASGGRKGVAEALLANKADVNAKTGLGATPLHEAAIMGRKDVAALLLAHNGEVNAKNNHGETPLATIAATYGGKEHRDLAKFLLANGADAIGSDLLPSLKQRIVFDGSTPSKGTNLERDKLKMDSAFNEAFNRSRYRPQIKEVGDINIIENGRTFVVDVLFEGSLDESVEFQAHVDRTFKKYGLR